MKRARPLRAPGRVSSSTAGVGVPPPSHEGSVGHLMSSDTSIRPMAATIREGSEVNQATSPSKAPASTGNHGIGACTGRLARIAASAPRSTPRAREGGDPGPELLSLR